MKPRAPLTTDQALARIAGQLPAGWVDIAEITGRSESLARAWGDPDRREQIPLDDAIKLDLAYQAAGGRGAPLADSYLFRLELAATVEFSERFELLTHTEGLTRETGEALAALLRACQPHAGPRERKSALKELIDVVEKSKPIIAALNDVAAPAAGQSP